MKGMLQLVSAKVYCEIAQLAKCASSIGKSKRSLKIYTTVWMIYYT